MNDPLLVNTSISSQSKGSITTIAPTAEEIESIFVASENDLPFCCGKEFEKMLTFTDNLKDPIHRWFYYKEGYSRHLVMEILKRYPVPAEYPTILDPFCGAGTTLLVAQSQGLFSVGVELNPFAAFLSQVKTSWHKINVEELETVLYQVLNDTNSRRITVPELTTFHKKKYFPHGNAEELFRLKNCIKRCQTLPEIKNVLQLALAAAIEDVCYLHKDGRLLRYYPRTLITPKEALESRTKVIVEDLKSLQPDIYCDATVIQGDARNLESVLSKEQIPRKFGLILYSPPYLNNFDYSEIYKCELWLLGFIKSYEQWKKLRLSSFRSHPSCKFPTTHYLREHPDLREVWSWVEQTARCSDIGGHRRKKEAPDIIRGYFDDIFKTLQEQINVLAVGGHIVCVVGNSKHGNLYIHTDTLIAKIGQALGLELTQIYIGKHRQDRKQKKIKLRESLIVFRKSREL